MARRNYSTGSLWTEPRAGGREVWMCQFYVHGKQYQRSLGTVRKGKTKNDEGLSPTQAEAAMREARARAESEALPVREGSPRQNVSMTIEEAGEVHFRWLESKQRKERTIEGYREMLSARVVPYFKTKQIAKITHRDVERFIDHLHDLGLKPETIKNYVSLLHAIFRTGVRRGVLHENVVERVDNVPQGSSGDGVIRYLRMEEVEAIIRAEQDDDLGRTMQTLYLVATMTGLRLGEMRALRWENIDFGAQKIRVERSYSGGRLTRPKSRKSQRAVPMPTRVAQALATHERLSSYTGEEALVFCHPHHGGYLSDQTIRDRYLKACRNAGVRKVRLHDLRHTYGTLMASAGTPLRVLQGLMGHASYSTTEVYAKWAPDQTAELALAERAFMSATSRLNHGQPAESSVA